MQFAELIHYRCKTHTLLIAISTTPIYFLSSLTIQSATIASNRLIPASIRERGLNLNNKLDRHNPKSRGRQFTLCRLMFNVRTTFEAQSPIKQLIAQNGRCRLKTIYFKIYFNLYIFSSHIHANLVVHIVEKRAENKTAKTAERVDGAHSK